MGVRNYLIKGISCSGKTTVCNALQQRGYQAIHGDNELSYWGDPETGEALTSSSYEHWIWDVDKVRALVSDQANPLTFLCGGSRNTKNFIHLLDGAFVLEVDLDTLNRRLALRPASEWSGSPGVGAANARQQHSRRDYVPENAILVDGTAPIEDVVEAILAHIK